MQYIFCANHSIFALIAIREESRVYCILNGLSSCSRNDNFAGTKNMMAHLKSPFSVIENRPPQ